MSLPLTAPPPEAHLRLKPLGLPRWLPVVVLTAIAALSLILYFVASPSLQAVVAVAALPFTGGTLVYLVFRQYRFNQALGRAGILLRARRLEEAQAELTELATEHRWPAAHHAQTLLALATCRLLQGDAAQALAILSGLEGWPGIAAWATTWERIPGWMALGFLAQGDGRSAAAWVEEAGRRCDATSQAIALLPEAVLSLQRGEPAAAAERLTRTWTESEVMLVGEILPELRLVRALAESQRPGADAAEIDALLSRAAVGPEGYRWLSGSWPALQRFVERRGLTGPAA